MLGDDCNLTCTIYQIGMTMRIEHVKDQNRVLYGQSKLVKLRYQTGQLVSLMSTTKVITFMSWDRILIATKLILKSNGTAPTLTLKP